MKTLIQKYPVISILRNIPEKYLVQYVNAIINGGIHCFEVALNTPDGDKQIKLLKQEFKNKIVVGGGTAITKERIDRAVEAGAEFLLTPSSSEKIIRYCHDQKIKILPGVMTPTDVELCVSYGYDTMKLFPAGDLPLNYVKSLKGPFDQTDYVAVGGISLSNAAQYLDSGYSGVGIASGLVPDEYIINMDWPAVTAYIRDRLPAIMACKSINSIG